LAVLRFEQSTQSEGQLATIARCSFHN